MPERDGEVMEINLGEVTAEEILIGSYEALKLVLAASIAQLTTEDPLQAKSIFSAIANDCDVQRARFIQAMRADAQELVAEAVDPDGATDAEISVDPQGFEHEVVIDNGDT